MGTTAARIHSLATGFVGGVLGFGLTLVLPVHASGTFVGVLAATAIFEAIGLVVDVGTSKALAEGRSHAQEPFGEKHARALLWLLVGAVMVVVGVPLSAALAPQYALSGVIANVLAMALVYWMGVLVYYASPWREGGVIRRS